MKNNYLIESQYKDNFIKNIFNELLKYNKATEQCTKDSYLKEANIKLKDKFTKDDYEMIQKMTIIKDRYSFVVIQNFQMSQKELN